VDSEKMFVAECDSAVRSVPEKQTDTESVVVETQENAAPVLETSNPRPENTQGHKLNIEKGEVSVLPEPKIQIDISKGLILPPTTARRKRGRPRKNPLVSDAKVPAQVAPVQKNLQISSLTTSSSPRKKRRRKVKGYPWGSVKKKKKKACDVSSCFK